MSHRLDTLRHREAELAFQYDIASTGERETVAVKLAQTRGEIREQQRRDEAERPAREQERREMMAASARSMKALAEREEKRRERSAPRIILGRLVR